MQWMFNNYGSPRGGGGMGQPVCKHEWVGLSLLTQRAFCKKCNAELDAEGKLVEKPTSSSTDDRWGEY